MITIDFDCPICNKRQKYYEMGNVSFDLTSTMGKETSIAIECKECKAEVELELKMSYFNQNSVDSSQDNTQNG